MWLLLLACQPDEPPRSTLDTSVDPSELAAQVVAPGGQRVGYRVTGVSWTDPLLTAGEPRELRVSVWYPTEDSSGGMARYQDAIPAEGVLGDASLSPGTHPVAVFSHGHQAYGEAASFLAVHLASHGWVVVAPDHLGNLTWDGDARDTEIYLQRPLDLSAVLDWLDDPGADPLAGALRPERLALGHSFGGYTIEASLGADVAAAAVEGCPDGSPFCSTMTVDLADRLLEGFADPRWTAAVSMAPGDVRLLAGGMGALPAPVLLMTGGLDGSPGPTTQETWLELGHPDDVHAFLPLAGHNAFTDFSGNPLLDPPGTIDPELGWEAIRGWVLAFGRARALGEPGFDLLLDGTEPIGDPTAVEVATR